MRNASSRLVAMAVVVTLATAPLVHAAPPDGGTAPDAGVDGGAPPPPRDGGSEFDFFSDDKAAAPDANAALAQKLKADALDRQVKTRRKVLSLHQAIGFTTLGLLAVTLVLGTLNYVDKFEGDFTGRYNAAHLGFAVGSSATFLTTGVLGLAAPQPYKKPIRLDTALLHKVMMGIATACFVAQLVLGPVSTSREGQLDQRALAGVHLGVGYGAFAAMTAGWLVFVIK